MSIGESFMIELRDLSRTAEFGEQLGKELFAGAVVLMNGDLGAGKTTMTKSIAKGMGIEDYVTSPTFTIVNEYGGKLPLYHIDTYRLEEGVEVDYLGFDEYFYGDGVTIVEWAEKIRDAWPEEYLLLEISGGEDSRCVSLTSLGKSYDRIKELLHENFGN